MKFYELHEIAILANWMLDEMAQDTPKFYKEHIKPVQELRKICAKHSQDADAWIDEVAF